MEAPPRSHMQMTITTLLERGVYSFQQRHYAEGAALLALASHHLSPELTPVATFLDMVVQECRKYTCLQESMHTLGTQYAELSQELTTCVDVLLALESQLSAEVEKISTRNIPQQQPDEYGMRFSGLYAVCLAPFEIRRNGVPLALCSNRNAQAILRYLIAQQNHRATVDTLMSLFWPDDDEEVALHKLHVAISVLRQCLVDPSNPHQKYILSKHKTYSLNPALSWHSDVEEFLVFYNTARKVGGRAAIPCYEKACSLYTRPLLLEDIFADWSFLHREHLRQIYEEMCNTLASLYLDDGFHETAAQWVLKIIEGSNCNEAAYRLLMSIYAMDSRRHEALQLYRRCQQVLQEELNVQPMPETEMLYQEILRGDLKRGSKM